MFAFVSLFFFIPSLRDTVLIIVKDLDGLSKHHPSITCRGRVERRGQSTSAPASQGGISCNSQQALGPGECCSLQPKWCARVSPLLRVVILYSPF